MKILAFKDRLDVVLPDHKITQAFLGFAMCCVIFENWCQRFKNFLFIEGFSIEAVEATAIMGGPEVEVVATG